jgi:hypothetical protein
VAKVSHMVSGLIHTSSMAEPRMHSPAENTAPACPTARPRAVGRQAVRFMCSVDAFLDQAVEGRRRRRHQPDARRHDDLPACAQLGTPGTASTMPIRAQNTISCTTRGLVSA